MDSRAKTSAKDASNAVEQSNVTQDSVSGGADAAQNSARNISRSKSKKSVSAFRTISEVADDLGVQQHVLRFWETKFSQVKPLKRGGGRRYYRPEDVSLLQAIYRLLYVEGYTIKGVQKLLREAGKKIIVANYSNAAPKAPLKRTPNYDEDTKTPNAVDQVSAKAGNLTGQQRKALEAVLAELKELRGMIKKNH